MPSQRIQITPEQIKNSLDRLYKKYDYRLKQKGHGTFASIHEILGCVQEEMYELTEAVKINNHIAVNDELLDIAVAAVFGVACIDAETVDW